MSTETQPEYIKKYSKDAHDLCKMLYSSRTAWEVDDGWYELLYKFSFLCEELNDRFYPKYRCKIVTSQIKQKYGGLRIYADVVHDPNIVFTFISNILSKLSEVLSKIDFKLTYVQDTPQYKKHDIKVFNSKEEFEKTGFSTCSNVKSMMVRDKTVSVTHYDVFAKRHTEPQRFKILYKIKGYLTKWSYFFDSLQCLSFVSPNKLSKVMKYMNIMMDKYIQDAENEASNTCEHCGSKLNDKYNKCCETLGYVMNLCEKCAIKTGTKYIKDDKIYLKGEYVKDCEGEGGFI